MVGGLACLISAAARLAHPGVTIVGVALLVGGGLGWLRSTRCPQCNDHWVARSFKQRSWREAKAWRDALQKCPECSYAAKVQPPASD